MGTKRITGLCLLIASAIFPLQNGYAVEDGFDENTAFSSEEVKQLREWIGTKRLETINQIGGKLSISGQIRTGFISAKESHNGVQFRGLSTSPFIPSLGYAVDSRLLFDYRNETNWASIKLRLKNRVLNANSSFNSIALDRAVLGSDLFEKETFTSRFEVGRRGLLEIFDSKIQFGSYLNGFSFYGDIATDNYGDFYIRVAPFIADGNAYRYALASEIGVLSIANTGGYAKYSFITWDTRKAKTDIEKNEYRFVNSQLVLGYTFVMPYLEKQSNIYAGGVVNHAASKAASLPTNGKKENIGGYIGFSIGQVRQKWDWAFDVNAQYVGAQAVPSFDVSGIGRGNALGTGLYSINQGGTVVATTAQNAVGNANYAGVAVEFLFVPTNNVTITQSFAISSNASKDIGPDIQFRQYSLGVVYAF